MMHLLSTDLVSAVGCKRGREFATESWQQHSERAISESSGTSSGCKRGREFATNSWQQLSERAISESGRACKLARYGGEAEGVQARENKLVLGSSTPTFKVCSETNCKDEDEGECGDPLDIVGVDIFLSHILPCLDSRSLARSAAVGSRWRPFALADTLWQPLVETLLAQRAHLPLCLMGRNFNKSMKQHLLYTIVVMESKQEALVAAEMCRRTWELRLKPPCGPYWLSFDPTQVGKPGLNRYFSCDGRLHSDPGDPIWGGHACEWEFIRLDDNGSSPTELGVRINHWPPLAPRRVQDGRWVLENFYGLYITRPDNPAFAASGLQCHNKFASSERRRLCRNACPPPIYGFQI